MHKISLILTGILILTAVSTARTGWPDYVTVIDIPENSETSVRADLGNGRIIPDLDWADDSSVACFPGTYNKAFRGHHLFFAAKLPPRSELEITATPDAGVDISLYALQTGAANYSQVPPAVSSVVACEESCNHGYANPGRPESVMLNSIKNSYNVLIGIAGPEGTTAGSFTLHLKLITAKPEPEAPAEIPVRDFESKMARKVSITGNLESGVIMPLTWAGSSQIACFPGTQNEGFWCKYPV